MGIWYSLQKFHSILETKGENLGENWGSHFSFVVMVTESVMKNHNKYGGGC